MNNRIAALVIALGISTTPVFAKQSNRRADSKDSSSKLEKHKQAEIRAKNSYKRLKKIELEKEFIREKEAEISNLIGIPPINVRKNSAGILI
jgi:hypothetical protein